MARPYSPESEYEPQTVSPLMAAALDDMRPGAPALPSFAY
jgi:hypothetical protein